ncbi:carboxypeptidase regulatory-like domain-containing protein [Candidatus Poribacteria bacterium]|nr:carboxypeptidase regulatory-like domain-containing protein [Candidatus Poribacteria bacterium]MYF57325.1 carboxypeptidase regulatory-like domain-containing protein [Candidatus Poribacteria bacterium]MYI93100.1 carboxypeptidase regulatory-like domain-containing protein [Candidatus Poribacteria bacterium]
MIRIIALTMMILCFGIFTDNLTAEDEDGGTIKGEVLDTTPEQNPIFGVKVLVVDTAGNEYTTRTNKKGEYEIKGLPGGRYTISYTKDGYGDRVGKTKLLAEGGEIFDRIKMHKQENILTLFADILSVTVLSYILFFFPVPSG